MSWRIASECVERRFGSAARKQIIMFLADKASEGGSGIWCFKGTIQCHTGFSESAVKRTIIDFLQEGIWIETGRRHCKNGYIAIYRIVLERVAAKEVEDLESEKILVVYPQDRIRDRRTSQCLIAAALKACITPDDLLHAVKAYAKESEGYTRSQVCFSDN
jgi:hypothetical protein